MPPDRRVNLVLREMITTLQVLPPTRYVDEFTFRLNEGNVKIHTLDRLDSFVDGTADKRLTYKRLIACQN